MITPASNVSSSKAMVWTERLARSVVLRSLSTLGRGQLTMTDAAGESRFGDQVAGLSATISVSDPWFYRKALFGGTPAVEDGYIHGSWSTDDLTSLIRIFVRNLDATDKLSSLWSTGARWVARLFHRRNANTKTGSRRNIQAHYDLGNEFFRLWLDETLAYSSGIFPTFDSPLKDASTEKFDRVCRKLHLRSSDHVLEIGTGWGGFAIHAATQYGCRVTTTTISQQQFDVARERIREAGLADRVEVLLCDYRDLTGQYDKLVSIEMVEAVGREFLEGYFGQCGALLKPDGSLVIQAIVMPERRFSKYAKSVDFIQRYIFPGGFLPSVSTMLEAAGRATDLRLSHLEDFSPHYAETLRRWRAAFDERREAVHAQGYSEEFIRMWTYYLCYCEAAFEERGVGVVQVHFDKPSCATDPLTIGQRAAWSTGHGQNEHERRPAWRA